MSADFVRGLKCRLCGKSYGLEPLNFCTDDFGPLESGNNFVANVDTLTLITDVGAGSHDVLDSMGAGNDVVTVDPSIKARVRLDGLHDAPGAVTLLQQLLSSGIDDPDVQKTVVEELAKARAAVGQP